MLKREFKMKNGRYYMNKQNIKKLVIYGVIGLFLLITILSSFQTIKSGEVGLKVRFGKIVNTQLNEGLVTVSKIPSMHSCRLRWENVHKKGTLWGKIIADAEIY